MAAVLLLFAAYLFLRFSPYPLLEAFKEHSISTLILDRDGQVVQVTSIDTAHSQGLRREWICLSDMPSALKDAFIAAEDRHFFRHAGIDLIAIARAVYLDARHRKVVSGASTITMQLARMIRREEDSGGNGGILAKVIAKIIECFDALRLEARLSKDEILELYLNNVPFGFNAEGVQSAARAFFAVSASELTKEQCLCLAVIPRRPAMYNPLDNPKECARAAYLLARDGGGILRLAPRSARAIRVTETSLLDTCLAAHSYKYPFYMPHYIRHLAGEGEAMLLGRRIGKTPVIHLSASLRLQRMAHALLSDAVMNSSAARITQGALLACDTQTGEVLAWVGSCDFSDEGAAGQVDGVTALQRPGSAMKPFLYALALEKGFSPSTALPDVPLEAGGEEVYVPQNFNNRYNGPVRFRVALASSLNVPAVYLLKRLGMEEYQNKLHELCFSSLDGKEDTFGLSLALGGAEVSLLEMTRAFSVFPRDGVLIPLTAVSSPISRLTPDPCPLSPIIPYSPDTARIICSILSDASSRALGFGYSKTFTTPFPSIFKTGTANQYMSITAFGATPLYTVGVWMGNFNGNTVQGVTGSAVPAAVARKMLVALQEGESPVPFAEPTAWEKCRVCSLSGMGATPLCPDTVEDYVKESAPLAKCTWHTAEGLQYPAEYAQYLSLHKSYVASSINAAEPFCILTPVDGSVYFFDPAVPKERQSITVRAAGGKEEVNSVEWRVNSEESGEKGAGNVKSGKCTAEGGSVTIRVPLETGRHTIEVRRGEEVCTVSWECRE